MCRPSIDVFFHVVIEHRRGDAVCVLLTGMGRDGAAGLRAMREKGPYTIAQDEATSAVYGMPKAAAAIEAAVDILPIELIASRLIRALARPVDYCLDVGRGLLLLPGLHLCVYEIVCATAAIVIAVAWRAASRSRVVIMRLRLKPPSEDRM